MKTILLALLFPLSVSAQITNGDFDSPNVLAGESQTLAAGSHPEFPGWYVAFGSVDIIDPGSGDQVLDLNGTGGGGIQQTITAAVDKYDLSFTWAPNVTVAQQSQTSIVGAVVNWNSQTLAVLAFDVVHGTPGTSTVHLTVQGTGNDTLQFISRNDGAGGIMIDKVTLTGGATGAPSQPVSDPGSGITPVPEPRQYAAFAGLGLCAFAAWRRYFKKAIA